MADASNSGSEKSTDLKLVDEAPEASETDAPATAPEDALADADAPSRRGVPIWLFVLLALAFVLVVLWQVQVARELEAEVARVEAELARSTVLLDAHRSRLSEVRSGIHALSDQLDGLRSLADRPIDAAADASAAAPSDGNPRDLEAVDPETSSGDVDDVSPDVRGDGPLRRDAFETRPF
jgi:hypothetical protein